MSPPGEPRYGVDTHPVLEALVLIPNIEDSFTTVPYEAISIRARARALNA